mmetsp:Transcript_27002/g.38326  ORF Transcript_27002/g.38326 Transcript_27002/m.38326 type:complete len:123 (-) Transcript_27002:495-863(-)
MLVRENELRLCQSTRELYRSVRNDPSGWIAVVERLQRQVAREFGLLEGVGVDALRSADMLLPTEDVTSLSLYRKYNRCQDGSLSEGDPAPNVNVHSLNGRCQPLLSLSNPNRPLVLFAGSWT